MSVYTQQANILMEQLPEADQQFVVEFIKKISNNRSVGKKQISNGEILNQKEAVNRFIDTLNSVEPLADDELDEILIKGITLRTPEELDSL